MAATWQIQTPTSASGAIAIIQLSGKPAELNAALDRINLPRLATGQAALRSLLGIDRGLAVRWSESSVHLFPHGGGAVLRGITQALLQAGLPEATETAPEDAFPEASSAVEARMLSALARAASPLAVDLLLDQPRRWAGGAPADGSDPHHRLLNRLIDPPLVVAVGPSNIGKSSLLNTLAGRSLALVADEPGTTRDHIGALIDLAGLVVRYIDTPGIRPGAGAIETEAVEVAAIAAANADLILSCGDAGSPPLPNPPARPVLRVALRSDLGPAPWPHRHAVSIVQGKGVGELVMAIRDLLIPPVAIADPRPWLFRVATDRPETGPEA